MKKQRITLQRVLALDKEIIAKLNEEQLGAIEGGQQTTTQAEATELSSCPAFSCNPANCIGDLTTVK